MATLNEIIARAEALRKESSVNSIDPERVGSIMSDTLKYLNEFQLTSNSLGLEKIYASVSAMNSDNAPVSDLTGKPLKGGQLAVIVAGSASEDNGKVYRFDNPGWTYVSTIGNLNIVQETGDSKTAVMSQKAVTESVTEIDKEKVDSDSDLESDIKDSSDSMAITDNAGNIAAIVDDKGVSSQSFNICDNLGNILYSIDKTFVDSLSKNDLNYQEGEARSFGEVLETSEGITQEQTSRKVKHGTFSYFFEIRNNSEENYLIIDLSGESSFNVPFGFWMWINPFDQLNVDNFKAQILNDSNVVQAKIYNFGDKLYKDNSVIDTKDMKTLGGWIYLSIVGNPGTRLKLIFKSSVAASKKIASIYIDEYYYIGKRITPVFIFNGDGFYDRQEALDVYQHIADCGFTHSICGTYDSEQMPSLMKEQIDEGILEMGSYGGMNGNSTIATSSNYSVMESSFDEIITLSSSESDYRVPPILFGCQYHRLTPLIYRAAINSGYKVIKGGSGGWYANSYQQIFDHNHNAPVVLLPTGFTGSGNDAEFLKKQAKNWIDRTIMSGTVGLIFNHNYSDDPASEDDPSLFMNKEVMIYIIDYIKERYDAGECLVLSPTEFYEKLKTI